MQRYQVRVCLEDQRGRCCWRPVQVCSRFRHSGPAMWRRSAPRASSWAGEVPRYPSRLETTVRAVGILGNGLRLSARKACPTRAAPLPHRFHAPQAPGNPDCSRGAMEYYRSAIAASMVELCGEQRRPHRPTDPGVQFSHAAVWIVNRCDLKDATHLVPCSWQ